MRGRLYSAVGEVGGTVRQCAETRPCATASPPKKGGRGGPERILERALARSDEMHPCCQLLSVESWTLV